MRAATPPGQRFADAHAAGLNTAGTLYKSSRLKAAGTDGTDIGVDFEELRRAVGRDQVSVSRRQTPEVLHSSRTEDGTSDALLTPSGE